MSDDIEGYNKRRVPEYISSFDFLNNFLLHIQQNKQFRFSGFEGKIVVVFWNFRCFKFCNEF